MSLAGECISKVFCTPNTVWRKGIVNNFFFPSGTHTYPGTGLCTQPTPVFATYQVICKIMCCLIYVHICYSRSWLPACRCPEGNTRIMHMLTIQGPASVPLSMLWVTMQVGETWLPSPRAGDVNPFQSPKARAFSINLLNVEYQDMQWGCGVRCPIWTHRANSRVFHPKQRASDTTCCGSQRHQNPGEYLREKQEEPRKSCLIVLLHQAYSVPFTPLLPPVGYFVLLQTFHFVLLPADIFFFTQPVTVLVWLPGSQLGSSSQSLTCKQLQRQLLRQEDGWQHLPSETATHQK